MNISVIRKELFGHVIATLDAADYGEFGPAPIIVSEGREFENPDVTLPMVKQFIRPAVTGRHAWTDNQTIWENSGTLWIQCLGPLSSGKGLEVAEYQSIIIANAFKDKSYRGCARFQRVRTKNVGPSGGWYQIDVLIDYEFDELR